ncbi:hypothetical protein FRC02_006953 [Tulasnella sp. 418]|nr:hypothetical protein FRC02_006953 [Tulasnella sp. 418]
MKLSFSLAAKAKPANSTTLGQAPSLKKPAAFGSLDDEEDDSNAQTTSSDKKRLATATATATGSWRASRKKNADPLDATVSQYDEIWDDMKEAQRKAKEAKEEDNKERKPKYMTNLLNSAATRKLDYIRAEEKLIQREREAEGDEFEGKEKFVTQAYKDQMEAVRKAEEEEKNREELAKKKGKLAPTGLANFYREYLQKTSDQNTATVAATTTPHGTKGPTLPPAPGDEDDVSGPNLTIMKPPSMQEISDVELAKRAREEGKEVELNDDNQIVDKRELLSAGLNLSAPNTRKLGRTGASSNAGDKKEPVVTHRAVGTAASLKQIRERQAREIQRQMEEEEQRAQEAKEKEEEEQRARAVLKRNNEEDVKSARDRYLERKRRKLEEQAAAGTAE